MKAFVHHCSMAMPGHPEKIDDWAAIDCSHSTKATVHGHIVYMHIPFKHPCSVPHASHASSGYDTLQQPWASQPQAATPVSGGSRMRKAACNRATSLLTGQPALAQVSGMHGPHMATD